MSDPVSSQNEVQLSNWKADFELGEAHLMWMRLFTDNPGSTYTSYRNFAVIANDYERWVFFVQIENLQEPFPIHQHRF